MNTEEFLANPVALTDGQVNSIIWMWRCLYEGVKHQKVRTGIQGRDISLKFAVADVIGLGEIKLLEQNPHTSTIFGDAARNGIRIAWLFNYPDGGYVGPVLAQLTGEIRPKIYRDGSCLRAVLNPIAQQLE